MKQKCLECSALLKGRSDKKFCGDACRNAYNNGKNRLSNRKIRNINSILRKNRRILAELDEDNLSGITRDILIGKGFDFRYFTGMHKSERGKTYYFVYDKGFSFTPAAEVLIGEKEKLWKDEEAYSKTG